MMGRREDGRGEGKQVTGGSLVGKVGSRLAFDLTLLAHAQAAWLGIAKVK